MSLTNREIFRAARINLTNVYRLAMVAFLISNIVSFAIQLPFQSLEVANPTTLQQVISIVVSLLIALLSLLLTVGQYTIHLQLARPNETKLPSTGQVFYCFKNRPDRYIICGALHMVLFAVCCIPVGVGYFLYSLNSEISILLIMIILGIVSIAGIFFVLTRFSFSFFLLLDHEEMSVIDSFSKSYELTKNHSMQIFLIFLSFAGYDLLTAFTFGLAMLWVAPYEIQILSVCYLDLVGELSPQSEVTPTIDIVIE